MEENSDGRKAIELGLKILEAKQKGRLETMQEEFSRIEREIKEAQVLKDGDTIKEAESLSKEKIANGQEYLKYLEENAPPEYALAWQKVLELYKIVEERGGKALLVGGSVRDRLQGKIPKDFDVEVYRIPELELEKILGQINKGENIHIEEVGRAFSVDKIVVKAPKIDNEERRQTDIDVSMPRKDSKISHGHRGFVAIRDPNLSIREAARRRDFTINSMAANPLTGEVFDPFDGQTDLKNRVLKVTDEILFGDDPLRVLRAMQFIARMNLELEPKSAQIIENTAPDLKHISKERFKEEWDKLLLKAEVPSYGLVAGMLLGVFKEAFPEFVKLAETLQEFEWHPEGDVWIHTLMVVDQAARIARRENLNEEESRILLYATLCHDLGKSSTTEFIEGRIRSRGHEAAGVDPTEKFLDRLTDNKDLKDKVKALVADHLAPGLFYLDFVIKNADGKKDPRGAVRRLAKRIYPATIKLLALVGEADHMGRGPFITRRETGETLTNEEEFVKTAIARNKGELSADLSTLFRFSMPEDYPAGKWLLDIARDLNVEKSKPENIITGKQLEGFGFIGGQRNPPVGLLVGEMIKLANDLRDEGGGKYDTSQKIFNLLIDWSEESASSLRIVKDPVVARDRLKNALEELRALK